MNSVRIDLRRPARSGASMARGARGHSHASARLIRETMRKRRRNPGQMAWRRRIQSPTPLANYLVRGTAAARSDKGVTDDQPATRLPVAAVRARQCGGCPSWRLLQSESGRGRRHTAPDAGRATGGVPGAWRRVVAASPRSIRGLALDGPESGRTLDNSQATAFVQPGCPSRYTPPRSRIPHRLCPCTRSRWTTPRTRRWPHRRPTARPRQRAHSSSRGWWSSLQGSASW